MVRAIDADVHEGYPYIVMEYLEGDDLEHVFARRGPLPPDEVIEYMAQAARGLAHAHEKGVIHRDIKPTNVFLRQYGDRQGARPRIRGAGREWRGRRATSSIPTKAVVVGTTDFMSPEQVKDKPIDARTDLFSLGCTMYRLLTGTYAFPGLTREDRLIKRIRERHVPITEVRPGLSSRLVAIVDRLLAVRPDDRFGSAAEVAEALEALIPPAGRSERGTSAKPGTKRPGPGDSVPPRGARSAAGLVADRIGTPSDRPGAPRSAAPCGQERAETALRQGHLLPSQDPRRRGRRIRAGSASKIS